MTRYSKMILIIKKNETVITIERDILYNSKIKFNSINRMNDCLINVTESNKLKKEDLIYFIQTIKENI